ncbi:type II toxin-antitoxin system RelE/ParE family toxin [Nocardia cyriacigeorgica]|uniref:Type II toxin-antitoxin system RelE/ParE family toxin n=1 Tax=Nocardia cyriacigeorgica TaxID=135487 RepID=A0A6P1D978_9NOCA|nr:type II toxin-antitoxin system RelE/ParE family toxin [Nocardia cyriacigeorgica]NEW38544.1 type II toxin-antitoxin system RelE/ParE family toxin [Nocardia cyriacigeorgica]NEW46101.1 type II toxin-antitoxin system RelE/ParE family toxin [Nocardia cyriacigeorgica]NEW49571.1 type II toxin-antitoxin system RelE/ParE family toxin [Nocardia cyriacigeorgica]NEW58618.1 type II toxin-antitoxin system RelE/ParE family toxin [Nocardia cyriacigeorgica]
MNVEFHPDVLKQLQKLPRDVLEAALHAIIALTKDPRPSGAKKLVGRSDWRIRIGQYRIVYEIDDAESIIRVFAVAKRSDVYR